jgi:hypothetical protein
MAVHKSACWDLIHVHGVVVLVGPLVKFPAHFLNAIHPAVLALRLLVEDTHKYPC